MLHLTNQESLQNGQGNVRYTVEQVSSSKCPERTKSKKIYQNILIQYDRVLQFI